MKKLNSLAVALAAALAASATPAGPKLGHNAPMANNQLLPTVTLAAQKALNGPSKAAPARMAEAPDPITEKPAGREIQMSRSSQQFLVYIVYLMVREVSGTSSTVIISDDGSTVYFPAIISALSAENPFYVKGTIDGQTIKVDFPQVAYEEQGTQYTAYVFDDLYNTDDPQMPTLSDNQTVEFSYIDGVISQVSPVIMGLGADDDEGGIAFMGFGDTRNVYAPFNEQPQTLPEGLETESWAMTHAGGGQFIDVAFDGNDVYLTNLSAAMPEAVVKGTINGDKVTFESGQYLGDYQASYYMYFMAFEMGKDENGYDTYSLVDKIDFAYDAQAKKMTCPEGYGIDINVGKESVLYLDMFTQPSIFYQDTEGITLVPSDPADVVYTELPENYWDSYGYGEFTFDLPIVSKEGYLMDTSKMFYIVYVDDDEPITFDPVDYQYLGEEMEEIPYDFTESWDFYATGAQHTIYIWFTGFDRIGVQGILRDGDTQTVSNIVYNDGTVSDVTTGVENIAVDNEASTEAPVYFDLSGRRVANPSNGLFIMKAGNKAVKVIR